MNPKEKIKELKLDTWFHTSVSVQRNESEAITSKRPQPLVILPGDLLHVDFGITYLRLNTDTQQHAYILKAGETDAPEYLKNAFAKGNKLQDFFTDNFKEGRTGNQILAVSRRQAIDILLDRRWFALGQAQYNKFITALDAPPKPTTELKKLLAAKSPWEK